MQSAAVHHPDDLCSPSPGQLPNGHGCDRCLAFRALFQSAPWRPSGLPASSKLVPWKPGLDFLLSDPLPRAVLVGRTVLPSAHNAESARDHAAGHKHVRAVRRCRCCREKASARPAIPRSLRDTAAAHTTFHPMRDGDLRRWARTSTRPDTQRRISSTFRFVHTRLHGLDLWALNLWTQGLRIWNLPFLPAPFALAARPLAGGADRGWHKPVPDALRHSWVRALSPIRNPQRQPPARGDRAARSRGSRMPSPFRDRAPEPG